MDDFPERREDRSAEIASLLEQFSGVLSGTYRADEVEQLRSEWE